MSSSLDCVIGIVILIGVVEGVVISVVSYIGVVAAKNGFLVEV